MDLHLVKHLIYVLMKLKSLCGEQGPPGRPGMIGQPGVVGEKVKKITNKTAFRY